MPDVIFEEIECKSAVNRVSAANARPAEPSAMYSSARL